MPLNSHFYLVIADFQELGYGNCCDPTTDFDHAVDVYSEFAADGREVIVYLIMPPSFFILDKTSGLVIDVTPRAKLTLEQREQCQKQSQ